MSKTTREHVRAQFKEAKQGHVTCECGGKVPLRFAYRCYDCGAYFCKACAGIHFGRKEAGAL